MVAGVALQWEFLNNHKKAPAMTSEIRQFNSSAIGKAGYNPATRVLTIWFTSNPQKPFDYMGVPPGIWSGMLLARSTGTYYTDHIRGIYGDHR